MLRNLVSSVVLSTVALVAHPGLAVNYELAASITQLNAISGERSYDFQLRLSEWSFPSTREFDLEIALISPHGLRFEMMGPDSFHVLARFNDYLLGDLEDVVLGDWLIEERINNGPLQQYHFTVPQFDVPGNFYPPPTITLPTDGAVVGPVFEVHWTSGGSGFSFGDSLPAGQLPEATLLGPGRVQFDFTNIAGIAGTEITNFRNNRQRIVNEFWPVTSVTDDANSSFPTGWIVYRTESPPVSFTIVPEPSTGLFSAFAILVLGCSGRRVVRRQKCRNHFF